MACQNPNTCDQGRNCTCKPPVCGLKNKEGKIEIIEGTSCSPEFCQYYGCAFPDCANSTGEVFDTEEEAKAKYSDIKLF